MVAVISASIAVRPPITVIGPLADTVHASTGLSSTAIGVLTTLPLVVFMLVSAHVSRVARRLGMEVAMAVGFALVLAGSVIRWFPSIPLMYLGTAVVAIGLTMPNVLLPGIIRRDFQTRIGPMTSLYIALTAGGAGVVSRPSARDRLRLGLARDYSLHWSTCHDRCDHLVAGRR
jgi:CP family cyanate transporter-like MFS transporter